jgi:hypothetical protein
LSLQTLVVPPVPTVGLCIFAIDGNRCCGASEDGRLIKEIARTGSIAQLD